MLIFTQTLEQFTAYQLPDATITGTSQVAAAGFGERVFVFGSSQADDDVRKQVHTYDFSRVPRDQARRLTDAPVRISGGWAVTLGDRIFVAPGTAAPTSLYRYDPATDLYALRAVSPMALAFSNAAVLNTDQLHIVGGTSNPQMHYSFNDATNAYSARGNPPQDKDRFGICVLNNILYAAGCYKANNSDGVTNGMHAYDGNTHLWSTCANMPRHHGTSSGGGPVCVAENGRVYIAGGQGTTAVTYFNSYDPTTNTYTANVVAALGVSKYGCGSVYKNGWWYMIGQLASPYNSIHAVALTTDLVAGTVVDEDGNPVERAEVAAIPDWLRMWHGWTQTWYGAAFTGGLNQPDVGDWIEGVSSGHRARLAFVEVTGGSWAGNNASGLIHFHRDVNGHPFFTSGEVLRNLTKASQSVCTITAGAVPNGRFRITVIGKGDSPQQTGVTVVATPQTGAGSCRVKV